jgi:tRNA 2-thiouridine synthesizing protein C
MKKFLFVMRRPPYQGIGILESLDMIMTVAAFDQCVNILFLDDAVFLLKANQTPDYPHVKPSSPVFAALAMYDVETLWVEQESLSERGLNLSKLMLPAQSINRAEIANLIAEADIVVNC